MEAFAPDTWVLPIAVETDAASAIGPIVALCTTPGFEPGALVNLVGFRFGAGPMGGRPDEGERALERIDATLVSPLVLGRQTREEWLGSRRGLDPSDLLVSVMLPEFDGATNQVPIAAAGEGSRTPQPLEAQLAHLVGRVRGLLRLRRMKNAHKRVALVGYDYPAGEGKLLAASQLDVAASMAAIIARLAEEGYSTQPVDAESLRADLLRGSVNSPSYGSAQPARIYPADAARSDLANPDAWSQVDAAWTERAGDDTPVMTTGGGDFLVPGVQYGNVFVGVQPGRGDTSPAAAHDDTMPPHPQYLAYYTWLRTVWRADVIVHVGTHGTFEFLRSRPNAVGAGDFPDLMLGDVPHVYVYYVGNPAEGLVARRRSHAVIVSHQPPVFAPGGLHGEVEELAQLLDAHRRSVDLTPQDSEALREQIARRAEAMHWPTDPNHLSEQLERLRDQLVPMGLHVFGDPWTPEELTAMVQAAVLDSADGADLVDAWGEDRVRQAVAQEVDATGASDRAASDDTASDHAGGVGFEAGCEPATDPATRWSTRVRPMVHDLVTRFSGNREWDGLARALSGRHVPSRLGGDVVRHPDVLPSGGSLHQFDTRQVPGPQAVLRGAEMAEQLRQAHRRTHDGADPRCVGLVLWGLETTRTQGEAYAQVLSLIGVRSLTVTRPGQRRWQVVPTAELTAPRVDVVLTMSGFFRDLYPGLADDLDDMFTELSALDEPEDINPIAARTRATRERLLIQGVDERDADDLARARVFGPAPGLYSTGLTDLVEEGSWDTRADLAEHFTVAAHHVYTRNRHGVAAPELYRERLGAVQLVAQSRSTNEHHVTDLDHYFEFLGGMGAAVAAQRGGTVPMLVTDTTGRRVHTDSLTDAVRLGLHAQLLNPTWIEAMLSHGHQGVGEMAERTLNLLGLSATSGQVENWMFDAVCDRYLGDDDLLGRMMAVNPHATAQVAERLGEAEDRGLWSASAARHDLLRQVVLNLEGDLEDSLED